MASLWIPPTSDARQPEWCTDDAKKTSHIVICPLITENKFCCCLWRSLIRKDGASASPPRPISYMKFGVKIGSLPGESPSAITDGLSKAPKTFLEKRCYILFVGYNCLFPWACLGMGVHSLVESLDFNALHHCWGLLEVWGSNETDAACCILYPLCRLYVAMEVHEPFGPGSVYILWVTLITWKLFFSYIFEVYSIVLPSLQLIVYLVDKSIFYASWQAGLPWDVCWVFGMQFSGGCRENGMN